ncbi:hypothetical protein FAZ19_21500 [Sphingobacterium alkalisoli]|uniref:Uncharacterized protein n=1 Tax=Sphingobacterium alkalisoli TaxID=1874115 RepID=A0A4U0GRK3_9SPHI|nr:hypothetical protein [Sphingobacterium alkalisoli]TJY61477.1 hypothetical protein FAZ19_21500 [Sphingobacterium alkalisoli]GGH30143.1 hypothetical protein GCM10011418_41980 [Sphingobacterium alkalisoli]
MPQIETHIGKSYSILLIWFILFSLLPCTVKEVMFDSVDIDYSKPLNKSKAITQTNLCQYSSHDSQYVSVVIKSKFNKQIEPIDFCRQDVFVVCSAAKGNRKYAKTFSRNSPPKYILYKRMKIDIG